MNDRAIRLQDKDGYNSTLVSVSQFVTKAILELLFDFKNICRDYIVRSNYSIIIFLIDTLISNKIISLYFKIHYFIVQFFLQFNVSDI